MSTQGEILDTSLLAWLEGHADGQEGESADDGATDPDGHARATLLAEPVGHGSKGARDTAGNQAEGDACGTGPGGEHLRGVGVQAGVVDVDEEVGGRAKAGIGARSGIPVNDVGGAARGSAVGGDVNVQEIVEDRVRDADEEPRGENQAGGPDDKLVGEEDLDVGPGGVPDLPECNREACGLTGIEVGLLDLAARLKLLQGQRARSVVLAGDVHDGFIGLLVPADGDEELGCLAELQYEQTQQCGTHYYSGVRVPAVSPASVHPGGAVVWVGAGVVGNKGPRDQGGDCLTNSPPRSHGGVHVLVLGWEELEEDGHVGGNVTPGCNGGEKHEDAVHCITGGAAGEEAEEGREDQGRVEGDFPANQVGTKPKQNRTSDQPGVEDLCRHGIPTALHLVVDVSLDCGLHHLHLRVDRVSEPGDAKELHVEPRKADLVDGIVHKVDFPLQRHVAVLDGREVLHQVHW
ncbi:hypothetical protein PMKS-004197 [Pichia membranifaciens]|uniref:Uncharacterized protein n=1 Tax=Pichia membranifaciens TaxID=4926 RepID=A0A1Q2YM74_9ASCO|nr:hypothetical protein PMKS-004197 [Pichia membranifaciens]